MTLKEMFKGRKTLLSDGAWGTEFAKMGLGGGICPELLNVEKRDAVFAVARAYVEAGSDFILTNTFGGSPYKLKKYAVDDRLEELNEAGVRISREAAGDSAFVLGSIGPTGEFLAPLGTVTDDEMTAGFARQVRAFVNGGADGVLVETMTDLGEMLCAVRAVRENSDLPVICSMTFDKGARGYATMMGVKPDDAARMLTDAGADSVGSNCGAGIDNMLEIAAIMRPATELPLWCKPNAGLPELVDGRTVYRATPEDMAARTRELIGAGANIVGGCCGSTPEHIRRMREVIDSL